MSAMRGTLRAVKGREHYWEIAVDAGRDPIHGKRARVVRGVHGGKRDAERALNQLVTDVSSGRASASSATVADLLDRWLQTLAQPSRPARCRATAVSPSSGSSRRWGARS